MRTIDLVPSAHARQPGRAAWRFGLVLAACNLLLLVSACPHPTPDGPATGNLIFALLGFIVYFNLVTLSQGWDRAGDACDGPAMLALHGASSWSRSRCCGGAGKAPPSASSVTRSGRVMNTCADCSTTTSGLGHFVAVPSCRCSLHRFRRRVERPRPARVHGVQTAWAAALELRDTLRADAPLGADRNDLRPVAHGAVIRVQHPAHRRLGPGRALGLLALLGLSSGLHLRRGDWAAPFSDARR